MSEPPAARRGRRRPARIRIGTLEEATGLSRDTIHFYLRIGLLHRPDKTAATVAYYDASHVERLVRIRALRAHGLALPTIRRLLDAPGPTLPPEDVGLLAQLFRLAEPADAPRAAADVLGSAEADLAASFGLLEQAQGDGALAAATARLARLPAAVRGLAATLAGQRIAEIRRAVATEQPVLTSWLVAQEDAGVALDGLREALDAVRATELAARDAVWRAEIEHAVWDILAALQSPRWLPLLPPDEPTRSDAEARASALEPHVAAAAPGALASLVRTLWVADPRRLGEALARTRRGPSDAPWGWLGTAVASLESGALAAARDACARALLARPGWALAAACDATAALRMASVGPPGPSLRALLAATRAVDRVEIADDDAPSDALLALLLKSRALLALPVRLGRAPAARAAAARLVGAARTLPPRDPSRPPGERAFLLGNGLLVLAAACRDVGDAEGERAALAEAATEGGPVADAALARLTDGAGGA